MMSATASETASEAKSEYRFHCLQDNNVKFISTKSALSNVSFAPFLNDLRSLSNILEPRLTSLRRTSSPADRLEPKVCSPNKGHSDNEDRFLEKARTLADKYFAARDTGENEDWRDILSDVWNFLSFKKNFSRCQDRVWKFDPALEKHLPNRSSLSAPRPNCAFGLNYHNWNMEFHRKLRELKDVTTPSVSPLCLSDFTAPFLIVVSKDNNGSIRTAENQLCNALIKGNDILNSLDLHRKCFLLGIAQVGVCAHYYLSISTQAQDGINRYADEIYVVFFGSSSLVMAGGCLRFLEFIDYAKTYAQSRFQRDFEDAVNTIVP